MGVLSGVVERVRSGEKQRFHGVKALAEIIATMARARNGDGVRSDSSEPIASGHALADSGLDCAGAIAGNVNQLEERR